jgi:hypothetical protein
MSYSDSTLIAHVALLERAEADQLDRLTCPLCKQLSVSVWFKGWERICSNVLTATLIHSQSVRVNRSTTRLIAT